MQTSIAFSQRTWPGHDPNPGDSRPDLDDCWAVSGIQMANVTAPWLRMPSVAAFRNEAGVPDTGKGIEGGRVRNVYRGARGCYPSIRDLFTLGDGTPWSAFLRELERHRPLSVSVLSGALPARLQYGFEGRHQVTVAEKGGRIRIANPLQRAETRWETIGADDLRQAMRAYGRPLNDPEGPMYWVAGPTDAQARETLPGFAEDPTPEDGDDHAEVLILQDRIRAGIAALTGD